MSTIELQLVIIDISFKNMSYLFILVQMISVSLLFNAGNR